MSPKWLCVSSGMLNPTHWLTAWSQCSWVNCVCVTVNFAKFTGVDFVDCMLDCLCFCAQENCQIYDDEKHVDHDGGRTGCILEWRCQIFWLEKMWPLDRHLNCPELTFPPTTSHFPMPAFKISQIEPGYSALIGEWSIAISLSVCVCVCPSESISLEPLDRSSLNFLCRSLWPWLGPPLAALRYVMYFRFYGWCHVWLYGDLWKAEPLIYH